MKHSAIIVIALVPLVCSCSATPGDAALRTDHPQQAADLYRRGTELGDASAALKLGLLIESGKLHDASYGTAGKCFLRSCDLGDVVGGHNAGVGFEYGTQGLVKNYEEARSRYERAARQGYMQSEYNLGSLYANQYFSDNIEGLAWLIAAQAEAVRCLPDPLCAWVARDPPGHIGHLKKEMSADEIAQAVNRSNNLVPK